MRKGGKTAQALENTEQAFKELNRQIWQKEVSDQKINKALSLSLKNTYEKEKEKKIDLQFSAETNHPVLGVRPDILISKSPITDNEVTAVRDSRLICVEICYTNNDTPGELARYVFEKLDKYMNELQHHYKLDEVRDI
jgi:hypothetical protein